MFNEAETPLTDVDFLKELNGVQYEAATHLFGPSIIIAGAGSGKTRVLTYRLAYIISQKAARASELMTLTFTNKAAREMRTRIEKIIGDEARYIAMGTFHSVFSRILRAEADSLGYTRDFTIYDEEDAIGLIKTIAKELNIDDKKIKPRSLKNAISNAKNYLKDASAYQSEAKDPFTEAVARTFRVYENRCRQANAMDFDDLLVNMDVLLRQNPQIAEKYLRRYRFLMVDEFQDTNVAQYSILRRLTGAENNLCVVGDDAQSIYSFRGATIENILNFQKDYPDTKVYKLEQNYRSTGMIIEAANKVISHNVSQIKKTIFTENPTGEKIELIEAPDEHAESARVVDSLRGQKLQNSYFNKDFAILYRTNAQSRSIEDGLRRAGVVYKIFGGTSFYRRAEIKDMVGYLRLSVNPHDEEAIKRVINYPARGIGDASMDKIGAFAAAQNITYWQALKRAAEAGVGRISTPIKGFVTLIDRFFDLAESMPAHDLVETIAKESGILRELHKEKNPENLSRYENVQELIKAAYEYTNRDDVEDPTIRGFLAEIALFTDQDQKIENDDYVTLMTIHAAKGLEFKSVFVVGLEEGLFPSSMSLDTREGIEEERRLFYVAVTRAEKNLTLSFARSRFRFGNTDASDPSRFLSELGDALPNIGGRRSAKAKIEDVKPKFAPPLAPPSHPQIHKLTPMANAVKNAPPSETNAPAEAGEFAVLENLTVGARVEHQKFGVGVVQSVEGKPTDRTAIIDFKQKGKKTLLLRYAKLRVL